MCSYKYLIRIYTPCDMCMYYTIRASKKEYAIVLPRRRILDLHTSLRQIGRSVPEALSASTISFLITAYTAGGLFLALCFFLSMPVCLPACRLYHKTGV